MIAMLAAAVLSTGDTAPAQAAQRFDFTLEAGDGWVPVETNSLYSPERGYGFEGEPAINTTSGALVGDEPLLFSAAVPEGDYRITVALAAAGPAARGTVRAEARRLMLQEVPLSSTASRHSFIVNVRTPALTPPPRNAPGGSSVRVSGGEAASYTWDDKLTLEFAGRGARIEAVEIEPVGVTRVFLLGDSTVSDQRHEDGASWGQMLPRFFDESVVISNHAESGETMKSFLTNFRFDKVLENVRPGDWALIQFGHNDSKAQWPQTYVEAATTYRAYLRTYVEELRRRGARPVLVTSVQRRTFGPDGRIHNSHGDYPDAVRAVALEMQAPLIDLSAASTAFYEALGPDRSRLAFSDNGQDGSHHNNYGAFVLAQAVVEGLRDAAPELIARLRPDAPRGNPFEPLAPEAFTLPPSAAKDGERPPGS